MDEIKKRLAFHNSAVQIQALWRLQQAVVKKKPQNARIDATTPEIAEWDLLLDCLCGDEAVLAELACRGLLQLVEKDVLDFVFALNSVLNSVPSAKCLSSCVEAVYGLLTMQALAIQSTEKRYKCPYGLRSPPHPLLSVIANRPESWPFVTEQAVALFRHGDKRVQEVAVELLRPYITFLLAEPQQSDHYGGARAGLRRLLQALYTSGADTQMVDIISLVLRLLPTIPIATKEQVTSVAHLLQDMSSAVSDRIVAAKQSNPDKTLGESDSSFLAWSALAQDLLSFGLEVLLKCINVSTSFVSLTDELIRLSQSGLGVSHVNTNLLLLSEILGSPHVHTCPKLIALAQAIVANSREAPHKLCLASLVLPLLHPLALPSGEPTLSLYRLDSSARVMAGRLLQDIQDKLSTVATQAAQPEGVSLPAHMSFSGYQSELVENLCHLLSHDSASLPSHDKTSGDALLVSWLHSVTGTLHQQDACSPQLVHLVAAVLVTSTSKAMTTATVDVIIKIAQVDPKQSPDLLPLILYVMNKTLDPESRLVLLEAIPRLATHKFAVPPILKTIQALGKSEGLKAVSIRLMMMLWQQQDRCFPQLLQAVSTPHVKQDSSTVDSVLLAKAAAILEICKRKPEQHGADLLAPLSDILNMADSETDTAVSVLALEGLCCLCEAEVIDLKSLWAVLGEKLIHETRPLVITRVCRLLSLVSDMALETPEYETFTQEAVNCLWLYSHSTNTLVSGAAFQALAKFSMDQFHVSHLPRKVTEELHIQAELSARNQETESGDGDVADVDQMFPQVPGSCYIALLQTIEDEEALAGYKHFLHAMTSKEAASMPRGVFHSSLRRQGVAAGQDKALESIPAFIQQQYDKCKQPGLRPGLAAGLLFCYNPPLEVGRDGRPRKHYVVRHGKTFLQTFTTLLKEVPVQPSEWHRCALIPQAWNSFMERLFMSMLEGRKAEIEIQEKHGHAAMLEAEERKSLAWLWVRDSILDVIKTASRGPPATEANCVLSLAGLALCVHKFGRDLDAEQLQLADSSSEHMGHSHWLTVTTDTILSLIDIEYKPKGGLHGLCQQRATLDRTPPSTLCTGMARLAASQLVPVYIATDTDKILHLLSSFSSVLPAEKKALELPVLAFCNSLALGMLLGRLFEEHYSEMTGSKGMLAVWKSLTALENVCLNVAAENRTGCVLGLGMAICGMCREGKTESRVHVTTILDKLQQLWKDTPVDDAVFQCLCVTVTSIAGSVYASNVTTEEVIQPIVDKLTKIQKENLQMTGACLALGLITFSLSKLGNHSVTQLRKDHVSHWLLDVDKEDTPPMEKIAKLNGLLAMIGSEQTWIPVQGTSMMTGSDVNVSQIITMVTKIVTDHDDLGLQNVGAWMLGHLYLSACAVGENRSSVPANFSYLPESSILRASVDFLLDAGRIGPESVSASHLITALNCLKVKSALPPLNWAGLLSPFMRVSHGEEVKTLSLEIAAMQVSASSSAAIFLSSWLTPPLFTSLQLKTQATLHRYMSEMIKSISPSVLKLYLERSCLPAFTEGNNTAVQLAVLRGLKEALSVDDPPEAVTLLLYEGTGQLYQALGNNFDVPVLQAMAECLAQVPDDILDSIIMADFADSSTQIKGSFVRCHLVAVGKQPLALLNYMIDTSFNIDCWNEATGLLLLTHGLAMFSKIKQDTSGPLARQQWLSELLGHTHSIVTGAMPLAETAPPRQEVIRCVINVVTCCIITLTYPAYTSLDLLGLNPRLFAMKTAPLMAGEDQQKDSLDSSVVFDESMMSMYTKIGQFLPEVCGAMLKKPWDVIAPKLIDWLMTLIQQSETSLSNKQTLHSSLMAMRHCQDVRQATVWTKALDLEEVWNKGGNYRTP